MNTQEIATIQPAAGLELAHLPAILEQNQGLAQRATQAIETAIAPLRNLDLTVLPPEQGEAYDATLADLYARGKDAIKANKDRREPFTQKMDEIRSMFTAAEKAIDSSVSEVKTWRDKWNAEKARRIRIQDEQTQRELAVKNAAIEYEHATVNAIGEFHSAQIKDTMDALNQAFYAQTLESMPEYETRLRTYAPTWTPCQYQVAPHSLLDGDKMLQIRARVEGEVFANCAKSFTSKLTEERDRLLALLPSRRAELERIATDANAAREAAERQQREQAERQQRLEAEAKERQAQATADAEASKMNTIFDSVAQATPAVELSKGTMQKRKYNVTTHKAMVAILQWWVQNQMPLSTVEDLTKKFSFMITAANKALNDGVQLSADGLLIEDDFSTRSVRSAKPKAEATA